MFQTGRLTSEYERALTDHTIVPERTTKRPSAGLRVLAMVLVLVLAGVIIFFALGPGWLYPRDVSATELYEHPSTYVGQKISVVGYLVKHTASHFGDEYTLCEGDPRNLYFAVNPCIAVSGESSAVDRYLSFLYDGNKYEVAPSPCSFAVPCRVAVSGVFMDRGSVTDISQYVIEASAFAWHE